MIRLKSKQDMIYSAFLICLAEGCQTEATKLWSTETNVIDVCDLHYNILEAEKYKS